MANNQYGIDVVATLNTTNVPKQLEELNTRLTKTTSNMVKIPIGIDKESGKRVFQELIKDVRTYKDEINDTLKRTTFTDPFSGMVVSDKIQRVTETIKTLTTETKKFTDTSGAVNTWVTTIDTAGQTVQTRTKEYTDSLGRLVKETSTWKENTQGEMQQMGEAVVTITDDMTKFENVVTETSKTVNKYSTDAGATVTVIKELTKAGQELKTVITEEATAQGELTKTTEVWNETTNSLISKHKEVINDQKKLTEEQKKLQQSLIETSKTVNRVKNDAGQIITTIEEVNKEGEKIYTVITETDNGIDGLVKRTEKYIAVENEKGEIEKKTLQLDVETIKNQAKKTEEIEKEIAAREKLKNVISTTTTTKKANIVDWDTQKTFEGLVTTIQTVDAEGKQVTKTIEKFTNSEGRLVEQTKTLDSQNRLVANSTRVVGDNFKSTSSDVDKANTSINNTKTASQNASQGLQTLNWSLTDAFRRLANFYLASLPLRAFQKAITETVRVVKDFDAAVTEMGKVTDYSGEKLRDYTKQLAEMGEEVARTQTEMTEATTGWLKAGYSEEDAANLAKYSALLQNTADEELSAAEATSILVSQLKAYHMEADEAIKVTDIINKVSANQAVSSYDISQGLTMASAAMSTFGNSIEQTTALLTAGTTVFQGRSKQVARGLNMIATRVSKNEKELEKYGVSIYNAAGELRSTYDILVDLAPKWESMSKAEQVALGNTLAGTNQYKILAAVMSQMDVAVESYNQALDASGETMKQNAVYMDSLEARTTALKAEFEKIVLGNGGLQDFAKQLVTLGTDILKFINYLGGLPTILITITSLLVGINALKIYDWIVKTAKGLTTLGSGLASAIDAWRNYIASLKAAKGEIVVVETETATLSATMQASVPIIGLVVAALGLLVAGIIRHNNQLEQQKQKIRDSIAAFTNEYKAIDNSINQLKNENISREELNSIIDSNVDEYEAERLKLLDVNEAREKAIELIQQEKKEKAEELINTGLTEYEESKNALENGFATRKGLGRTEFADFKSTQSGYSAYHKSGLDEAKTQKEQLDALKKYHELLLEYREDYEKGTTAYEAITEGAIKQTEQLIASLTEEYKGNIDTVRNMESAFTEMGVHYDETTSTIVSGSAKSGVAIEEEKKGRERLAEANKKSTEELKALQEQYGITEEAITNYIEAHEDENLTREQALEQLAVETEANIEEGKTVEALAETHGVAADELKKWAKALGISEEALINYADEIGVSVERAYEMYAALKSWNDQIDNLQSATDALSSAVEEYNSTQYLSLDTIQTLLQLQPEYLSMLVEENGQLSLNEQAIMDKVNSLIEERKQIALQTAYEKLSAIERGNNQAAAENESGAVYGNADALDTESSALSQNTIQQYANRMARNDKSKGTAASEVVRELEKEFAILDKLGDSYKSVASSAKRAGSAGKSGANSAKNAQKDLNSELQKSKSNYDKVIQWISKQYDKQIESIRKAKDEALKAIDAEIKALEKEKDRALKNIEAQIKAVEKQKSIREKYWNDQIDALKKQNKEQKEALELQEKLDALERAKNMRVKIYKEGEGFVYDTDQTEVAKAQKELDEYLSEQAYEKKLEEMEKLRDAEMANFEQRIQALNDYKDRVQESYERQIEDLQEYRESVEEEYDAQIEMYENLKKQFEEMVNEYEEQQAKLLFEQLTNIKTENGNWMTRLDNLRNFVNQYNSLLAQLGTADTSVGYSSSSSSSSRTVTNHNTSSRQYTPSYKSHASGAASIPQDELAVVGENPNQEIVIGSKLNNGELLSLDKGSGVVNAKSTNTLAGMLNQVGQFGSSGFGSGNGILNNNINNENLVINGVTIQGANIKDPESFVNGLLNLKAEALQRAYSHH